MTKPRGVDAQGNDVDLVGQPIVTGMGSTPGVLVAKQEGGQYMAAGRTFERYHYQGSIIRIFEGDTVPEGAVKVETPSDAKQLADKFDKADRARTAAPQNKARQAAPKTKSKDA